MKTICNKIVDSVGDSIWISVHHPMWYTQCRNLPVGNSVKDIDLYFEVPIRVDSSIRNLIKDLNER
jgi:hypothetical protein